MEFNHPTAPPSPNIPPSHFSNSSGYSADEGRDFGDDGTESTFYPVPEDESLTSEPSSATQEWDEIHIQNTRELEPRNKSFGTPSVRPINYESHKLR